VLRKKDQGTKGDDGYEEIRRYKLTNQERVQDEKQTVLMGHTRQEG